MATAPAEIMTPFGTPVVPEVNMMYATSDGVMIKVPRESPVEGSLLGRARQTILRRNSHLRGAYSRLRAGGEQGPVSNFVPSPSLIRPTVRILPGGQGLALPAAAPIGTYVAPARHAPARQRKHQFPGRRGPRLVAHAGLLTVGSGPAGARRAERSASSR